MNYQNNVCNMYAIRIHITSKQLYISDLENQHWTKSNDCLLTLVNRRSLSPASLVAPGTLRTASLQYIRHPAPKMHITNVHRPPKKCTFVKRRQSFRSPYILQHKNKILHILTRGKIALKKRFAHFFSVSHFPFSKCTFSSRF